MTVYTPNTPQASQTIAQTQSPIQQNFQYIEEAIERDHAWQGNIIGTEDPGRHQIVSMPNQTIDVTGALPTGCAQVMYTIGARMFSWDGTLKQPVSGVTGTGSILLNNVAQTLFTVPAESIGFFAVNSGSPSQGAFYAFVSNVSVFTLVPVLINRISITAPGMSGVSFTVSGQNIQGTASPNFQCQFKYIYWPV